MKRYSAIILIVFIASAGITSARMSGCGDGNQRYTPNNQGDTLRYFADVNQFTISQTGSSTVVIEDTVECRYGKDTVVDIPTIEFLNKSFSIDELVAHEKKKNLSSSVVQTFLFDNLAAQISNLGVDPFSDPQAQEQDSNTDSRYSSNTQSNSSSLYTGTSGDRYSDGSGSYTGNTNSFSTSLSRSNNLDNLRSSFTPGSNSTNSISSGANLSTYNNNSASSNVRANPYANYSSGNFNFNNTYSVSNSNTGRAINNGGFNSNSLASGISSAPLGQITARWNAQAVNPNAIVYIEAVDSNGRRHYLGSAMAGQGQRTLDVPSFLDGESSLTIYVRSGSTVVDTFDVQL
jgi:hypothetical protein